jgi:hypothetical protein
MRDLAARSIAMPLALALALGGVGCKTHSDHLDGARQAVAAGDYESAIEKLDDALGVDAPLELPRKWTSETALTVLERASVLHAMGDYALSARDLSAAETELEYFDLTRDTIGSIGSYIYSDSAEVYRALPVEQIGINALNVVNYLTMGNLQGARVEARRFGVVKEYLATTRPEISHGPFASYLAGFTFEHLGEAEEAMRFYDEALQVHSYESLRAPVAALAKQTPYRGKAVEEFLTQDSDTAGDTREGWGDLLVLASVGRTPYKVPERIAVGAAVGIYAAYLTFDTSVLERSATKVLVYPELVPSGSPPRKLALSLDGKPIPLELASDVGAHVVAEYEHLKPKIIAAALTRMVARAVASEGVRAVVKKNTGGSGVLAALGIEGLLVAKDKPDTRSWSFLPDKIYVARIMLPPGKHELTLRASGPMQGTWPREVEIEPGGFQVISIFDIR